MGYNKNISEKENSFLPLGKGSDFSTPPSYFDELPAEIMNRIHSSKKKQSFIVKPSFAIASLAVLACIVALMIFLKKDAVSSEIILSDNDIAHVVENPELYDLDADIITDAYISSNISYEPLENETAISDDEIKTFLLKNSDADNIINEF